MSQADYLDEYLGLPQGYTFEKAAAQGYTDQDGPTAVISQFDPKAINDAAKTSGYAPNISGAQSGKSKSGNPKNDWMSLVQGLSPSKGSIAQAFPQFAEWYPGSSYEGADVKGPWGWADTIKGLGSGDVGEKWQWYSGSGSSKKGKKSKKMSMDYFSDPTAKLLQDAVMGRLNSLNKHLEQQMADQYAKEAQAQADNNYGIDQYVQALLKRVGELEAPVYSQGEEALLRTGASDPLEERRGATLRNRQEEYLARTGFAPSSGGVTQLRGDINREFDRSRTQMDADFSRNAIQERQNRSNLATQLQGLIAQARGTKQSDRLGNLASLAQLEASLNAQKEARERERLSTAAILPELTAQRLQLALQTLGGGGSSIDSLMGNILGLGNYNQQQQQINNSNSQASWGNLANLASLIFGG